MTLPFRLPAALAAALVCASVLAPGTASAAGEDTGGANAAKPGIISVSGEGVVRQAPDMAIISLTVLREGETARQALDANNSAMGSVLSAMEADGIAEGDLQTSGFSIEPRYTQPGKPTDTPKAPEIVGYQVSNTLSVRIHDLKKIGDILDKSVSLGVNQGGNIAFTNEEPDKAIAKARKAAMDDAVDKAKVLASAAGTSLGKIRKITERSDRPRPAPMMRATMAKGAADSFVPVAAGENEIRVTVNVTWTLLQ